MADKLKKLKDPKTLGGLILGAIAFAAILSFADVRKVAHAFSTFPLLLIPVLFGLIAGREAVRIVEWKFLLRPLGLRPKWRHVVEGMVAGDFAQILPAGIFFQNYVLRETEGTNISKSLAATAGMQFLEAWVALIVLAVVPVPGWRWLHWVAIVVMIGFAAFFFVMSRQPVLDWIKTRGTKKKFSGWIAAQIEKFVHSIKDLLTLRTILVAMLLTGLYVGLTVATFYVVASKGYGLPRIGVFESAVIYCFALVIIVLNPLPSDWGVSEASGTAVFVAFGVQPAVGLTIMLILRFSILISTLVLTGIVGLIFRRDAREIINGPPIEGPGGQSLEKDADAA